MNVISNPFTLGAINASFFSNIIQVIVSLHNPKNDLNILRAKLITNSKRQYY